MANKKAIGHETENYTLTLHKFASINDLLADTQTPPELDPFVRKAKWVGSSEQLGVPRKVSLSDLRIDKGYDSFRLGDNTWVKIEVYTRFGIKTSLWVNENVLSDDLPWTVWIHDPRPDEKYGKYARFCGILFKSEDEAREWAAENVEQENTDSLGETVGE